MHNIRCKYIRIAMQTTMQNNNETRHRKKEQKIVVAASEDSKKLRNLDLMLTQLCTLDKALKKSSKIKREKAKEEKPKKVLKKKEERDKIRRLADDKHHKNTLRDDSSSPRPNIVINFKDFDQMSNDKIKDSKPRKKLKSRKARGVKRSAVNKGGSTIVADLNQDQLPVPRLEHFTSTTPVSGSSLEKRKRKTNKKDKNKNDENEINEYILREQVSMISIKNDDVDFELLKKSLLEIGSKKLSKSRENISDPNHFNIPPEGAQLSQIAHISLSNSKCDLTDIKTSRSKSSEVKTDAETKQGSSESVSIIETLPNDANNNLSKGLESNKEDNSAPFRVIKIKSAEIRLGEIEKRKKKKMSHRQPTDPSSTLVHKNKQSRKVNKESADNSNPTEHNGKRKDLPLVIGLSKPIHKERSPRYSAVKKIDLEQRPSNNNNSKYDNYHNSSKVSPEKTSRKMNQTRPSSDESRRDHERLRHHRTHESRHETHESGANGHRFDPRRRNDDSEKYISSQKTRKSTKNESRTKPPALKIDRIVNVTNYQHSKPVTSSKRNGLTDTLSWHQKANDAPHNNMTSRPDCRSNKTSNYRDKHRSLSNSTTSTSMSSASCSTESSGSISGSSDFSNSSYSPERRDTKYRTTRNRHKSSSDSISKHEPRSLNEKKRLPGPKYKRSNSSSSSFYSHPITTEGAKHKKDTLKAVKARQQRRVADENNEKSNDLKFGAHRKPRVKSSMKAEGDDGRSLWQHQQLVVVSQKPDATKNDRDVTKSDRDATKASKQAYKPATSFNASSEKRSLTIRDLYSLHNVLSDTQNGTVISGYRRGDGMRVAIKRISKIGTTRWGWLGGKVVPLELALLCQVNEIRCSGVVEIVEWHETSEAFLLVMVRPHPAVDLYDYVSKHKRVKEPLARHIIRKVVESLLHCTARGVLHRDVKLENVLLNPESLEITLIDFGCGDYVRNGPYKEFAGTPEYYAPEWFTRKQYNGEAMTVWSVGILLYSLLCGSLPFRSSKDITEKEIVKFPIDVTQGSRDLILEMLEKNPKERLQLNSVLSHQWFNKSKKKST